MKVKPLRIGITGGIASGKSETLEYLRKKNFPVICSDAIYHHLLNTRQALNRKIMTAFKLTSKNGTVDRKQLGAIVFSDKSKLQKLNFITHPHIIKEINLKIKALKNNPIIFIGIPLLFETGLESETDMIITVSCPKYLQLKRLMKRNNLSKSEALKRINSQLPMKYKIERSDFTVYNKKNFLYLHKQIDNIIKKIYDDKENIKSGDLYK